MSVIFNIRVTPDKNKVNVTVHRNGEAHKFHLESALFVALFENDDIYDSIVQWFGGRDNLPDLDSEVYENIALIYNYLKYPDNNESIEPQKGLARRLIGGVFRPSIIPQALIAHRLSPFADSEKVWSTWKETKPVIDQARREEQRLQSLQSAQESLYLQSEASSNFNSNFEALMAFRGVSVAHIKRSYFLNLLMAFAFSSFGLVQVYMFTRLLLGIDNSILNLPVIGVFSYIAWPLSVLVMVYCFTMAFIRLWFCTLINKRKLEYEYTFKDFLKSGKYIPGDFKEFGAK
jgi:hypothetical protein